MGTELLDSLAFVSKVFLTENYDNHIKKHFVEKCAFMCCNVVNGGNYICNSREITSVRLSRTLTKFIGINNVFI